jgi:hypothetical protein
VIGIGGVPHAEKKSQQHDGKQCGHIDWSILPMIETWEPDHQFTGGIP